jgi:hypothetical protein
MPKHDSEQMNSDPTSSRIALYQATAQSWVHAEQIRWTLLYNYLMTTSILLLAWAAVFTTNSAKSIWVLLVLAASGLLVSLIWIPLGIRASGFVTMYGQLGGILESYIELGSSLESARGPFRTAADYRRSIRGAAQFTSSWRVLRIIPTIFAAVYLALIVISFSGK